MVNITIDQKINFIIEQEKQANNKYNWIKKADQQTINELFEYWTQELTTEEIKESLK